MEEEEEEEEEEQEEEEEHDRACDKKKSKTTRTDSLRSSAHGVSASLRLCHCPCLSPYGDISLPASRVTCL